MINTHQGKKNQEKNKKNYFRYTRQWVINGNERKKDEKNFERIRFFTIYNLLKKKKSYNLVLCIYSNESPELKIQKKFSQKEKKNQKGIKRRKVSDVKRKEKKSVENLNINWERLVMKNEFS